MKKQKEKIHDVVIIGAGGTGLAAGMYAGRLGLKTLILGHTSSNELPVGGVITTTHIVENYPGFIKLTGQELAKKIEEHTRAYKKVSIKEEKALGIKKNGNYFLVKTEKAEYTTKTIIFATGTKWRKLPETIKGSREFENKGISYCALCDGPLYKNKIVAVIGGSDNAVKDALFLTEYAKKIYIIYRGEQIRPEPINMERVVKNKKVEIINNTNLTEIKGKDFVSGVILDKPYKNSKMLKVDGIFVAIGHEVLSEPAKNLGVKINEKGEIITDKTASTNIPGIFAAGDVTNTQFKQLITGVAEGCTAAYSAYVYINKKRTFG